MKNKNSGAAGPFYPAPVKSSRHRGRKSGTRVYRPSVGNMNVPVNQPVSKPRPVLYGLAIAVFILPIVVLGGISLFDKDQTVSEIEKRTLKTRPAFSMQALFSGSYTKDFENYYSDTFPFRDFFLGVNKKLSAFFTQQSSGDGIILVQKDNNQEDFGGEALEQPTEEQTEASTQQAPETQPNAPIVQAPEDGPVTQKGAVILTKDRVMELYSINKSSLEAYAGTINRFAAQVPDSQVYAMLAPTSIEFYAPASAKKMTDSQWDGIQMAYNALDSRIKRVDAYTPLSRHTDEYIYFRTDHHWTQRGAYYGYASFAQAAGFTPRPLGDIPGGFVEGDFLGSLKSYANDTVVSKPDQVEYFEAPDGASGQYFSNSSMTNGNHLIIVSRKVGDPNKYLAFIQGDTPLVRIRNENVANGKKILVVKESYGNALVPFLTNDYEEVYVVDPRKIDMNLASFVKENGIQEVLMVNYMFAPSNTTFMNALNKMIP